MGAATINVWITQVGRPCKITSEPWMVALVDCEGRILHWCGREYLFEAECGHIEITDVPPGCYLVVAARYIDPQPGQQAVYFNVATDFAVVRVNCGDKACVTLYVPPYAKCGYLLQMATQMLMNVENGIPEQEGQTLINAIDDVLRHVPAPFLRIERPGVIEEMLHRKRKGDDC